MKNKQSIKFNKDFYKELLQTCKQNGYEFVFTDRFFQVSEKSIFLRHDIDNDLGLAVEMARIENSLSIKSTYYIMVRSPMYNIFSRENALFIKEIIKLGHNIGLHFDIEYLPNYNIEIVKHEILRESGIIENEFNIGVSSFSYHQPSRDVLDKRLVIPSKVNVYNMDIDIQAKYFSDSNMNEDRITSLLDYIKEPIDHKIQLLIHPMWWMRDIQSDSYNIWNEVMANNMYYCQRQLLSTERVFGEARKILISRK